MITVNGQIISPTVFPDNTSQVWKLPDSIMSGRRWAFIEWEFTHEGEFMQLAQLNDLLNHSGIDTKLTLTYLPYGRQDKQVRNNQTFALRTFAHLLNSLKFAEVACLDPHSDVATELIHNFRVIDPMPYVAKAIEVAAPTMLAFPDKGAQERYGDKFRHWATVFAEKTRNQQTGEITGLELHGDPKGQKVLIIDDICDGGMTFIKFAEKLLEKGASEVSLYTTHGIYSKGVKPLKAAGIKYVMSSKGLAYNYHIRGVGNEVINMPFDYALTNYNYMEKKENQCT